jgi:hypothetical protein
MTFEDDVLALHNVPKGQGYDARGGTLGPSGQWADFEIDLTGGTLLVPYNQIFPVPIPSGLDGPTMVTVPHVVAALGVWSFVINNALPGSDEDVFCYGEIGVTNMTGSQLCSARFGDSSLLHVPAGTSYSLAEADLTLHNHVGTDLNIAATGIETTAGGILMAVMWISND